MILALVSPIGMLSEGYLLSMPMVQHLLITAVAPLFFNHQQIAGLIMWMIGGFIFLGVLTVVFFRWFNQDEYEEGRDFQQPHPVLQSFASLHSCLRRFR